MKHLRLILYVFLLIGLVACGSDPHTDISEDNPPEETLPEVLMSEVTLTNLDAFRNPDGNWKLAGGVTADRTKDRDLVALPGTGVLANLPDDSNRGNLLTTWEHSDIELELEVLMPKGSNSGVYLMGRYEVQLFDSWGVKEPAHSDLGGIYQRWDAGRGEGKEGFEGHPPQTNAAKAPGLWQKLAISFRAPRFNASGEKIENARFLKVMLNEAVIHENVEVLGPTRASTYQDEQAKGPLMIQGDHGPVAFRNIRYKLYRPERIALSALDFELYKGLFRKLPDFDALSPVKTGKVDGFFLDQITDMKDSFAVRFKGNIEIPLDGKYMFSTRSDDGSRLYIDGNMVLDHDGTHAASEKKGLVELSKGTYPMILTYFEATGGNFLQVIYEGPGIPRMALNSVPLADEKANPADNPLILAVDREPVLLRSFSMYGGDKRTQCINVGDPNGIHYAYDLDQGALLKAWKGDFADVTSMWQNRGNAQLAVPRGAVVEMMGEPLLTQMESNKQTWPDSMPSHAFFEPRGYEIDQEGRPSMIYMIHETLVKDQIYPDEEGNTLQRRVQLSRGEKAFGLWCRVAQGQKIIALEDGSYEVDQAYYLEVNNPGGESPVIRKLGEREELMIPVLKNQTKTVVEYTMVW